MDRYLLSELYEYFSHHKEDEKGKYFFNQLKEEMEFFQICRLHRDDLKHIGYDTSNVDDAEMNDIAGKLSDDYMEQLFWVALPIIVDECCHIPKLNTPRCPMCNRYTVEYDFPDGAYFCESCGTEWGDSFVRVQFPDDSSFFEKEDTGYPCNHSQDNGARYVREYDFIRRFHKKPEPDQYFVPLPWPESQEYMDEESEAIMDEKGLNDFGSSSFWVSLEKMQS